MASWKERKERLANRTKESADNRESKSNSILSFSKVPDMEAKWLDDLKSGRDSNNFDIIPFVITEEWYSKMRTFSGKPTGIAVGDVDYKLEFAVHRNVGPEKARTLCLKETFGKPCPVCEQRDYLLDNPKDDPEGELSKALLPKWRVLYNIVDLNSDDDIRLWEYSYHLFEKLLLTEVALGDEGLRFFWDIDDGKTISWRGKERKLGKFKFVEADRVDFEDRESYNEDIIDEAYPLDKLLVISTYDQIAAIMTGVDDDDDRSQKEEKPKEEKKSSRRDRKRYQKEKEEDPEKDMPWNGDENECKQDLIFGKDFDNNPKCNDCSDDDYNDCQKENERLKDEAIEKEKKEEPKEEKKTSRSRKRRGR